MRGSVGRLATGKFLLSNLGVFFSSFPVPIHLNIYYHTLFCLFFPSILIQFFLFYVCKFRDGEGSFFSPFSFFFSLGFWFGLVWSVWKERKNGESYIYFTYRIFKMA